MKKIAGLLFVLLLASRVPAWSQDTPLVEAFGGFSLLTVGVEGLDREWSPGWQGSFALNLTPTIGIVADFGGQYESQDVLGAQVDSSVHEFLFGPRFSARTEGATPFAHFLLGGARQSSSVSDQEFFRNTNFALGFGGGFDINMGESFSLRALQFDWLPMRAGGEWVSNQFRIGIGFVFKTGVY